jgi:hypothetical protein
MIGTLAEPDRKLISTPLMGLILAGTPHSGACGVATMLEIVGNEPSEAFAVTAAKS